MPKICLVNMDFAEFEIEERMAAEQGVELTVSPARDAASTIKHCPDVDGIVTSYGIFPRKLFKSLPRLKVIARTGVGYDTIDVSAATEHGVAICTAPGYANEVVSDHAITLAMGVLRRINTLDHDIREGIWNYASRRPLGQAYGRVFGIVGMGAIGRATARKAAGMGFKVICCSRSLVPGRRTPEGYEVVAFDDLLKISDVVSFHCALSPETYHMLNAERLKTMKEGAVVINTARGPIVDTVALANELKNGHLWGAGLDVFEGEPVDTNTPIFEAPHTIFSAHAAYWSEESGVELRTRTMQSAIDVVMGKEPADCLNPEVFGC